MVQEDFKQILDGLMLGDGFLGMYQRNKNANFIYAGSHRIVAVNIKNIFLRNGFEFGPNNPKEKILSNTNNKFYKSNKEYYSYRVRTFNNEFLTKQYFRWYTNKIKIIPKDLILTPLIVKHWYYGDGGLHYINHTTDSLEFSTHCFSYDEILFLGNLLCKVTGIDKTRTSKNRKGYKLIVRKSQIPKLLQYIGPCDSDFSCYQYKWIIDERKLYDNKKKICLCRGAQYE